ncbi:hypothetical protein VNO78_01372 [Psophocarpus tetragonolobus]|uniref:Uncharacterized protein n=1 Tax=Psophocarpus tetragonolobus TaxID=3891 RepID=A0AAN9T0D2_PSOTE
MDCGSTTVGDNIFARWWLDDIGSLSASWPQTTVLCDEMALQWLYDVLSSSFVSCHLGMSIEVHHVIWTYSEAGSRLPNTR